MYRIFLVNIFILISTFSVTKSHVNDLPSKSLRCTSQAMENDVSRPALSYLSFGEATCNTPATAPNSPPSHIYTSLKSLITQPAT